MPELPEVETTVRGIAPHVAGQRIVRAVVRERRFRQAIPRNFAAKVAGQEILDATRRGKYLLLTAVGGTLIIHLGMSGSLRMVPAALVPEQHDHVDLQLSNGLALRLRDPRRFGLMLWTGGDPLDHPLLKGLGPEPLASEFSGDVLWQGSRGRILAVKQLIMDAKVVVGVGNIYANEALFAAGIHPLRHAGGLSRGEYGRLVAAIKSTLRRAIGRGGTTLRDFVAGDGRPGYFQRQLRVYGRAGEPCTRCGGEIECMHLGQRATYFCARCQC